VSEAVHVVPVDDLRDHVCTAQCWCQPTQDEEEPLLYVHHAMDQRELYETGERKPA
jgi:hypothetical protein